MERGNKGVKHGNFSSRTIEETLDAMATDYRRCCGGNYRYRDWRAPNERSPCCGARRRE
jgi:hypothetical protein